MQDSDIAFGPEPLGPRVTAVQPLPDYKLALTFGNGEQRVFDAAPLLDYPAFKPLKDKAFFALVRAQYGTVCWPGDIDYCPDTLYQQSARC